MSRSYTRIHQAISLILLFAMLLAPVAPLSPMQPSRVEAATTSGSGSLLAAVRANALYRTRLTLRLPTDLTRVEAHSTRILQVGDGWVLAVVNPFQLMLLARLGFQPRQTDSLLSLGFDGKSLSGSAMLEALRVADSTDTDNDGLTDTEESWWCTSPTNPNSDSDPDGFTDGQEVAALLDFTLPRSVRWAYGPPFGPPAAWPAWNQPGGCNDGDYDTIPDFAETMMVGSRVPKETTDNDKFDDGQELFGVTYCPGAPNSCGYGNYPRIEYWNYIKETMPNWVLPPGDNLFVAAFPEPEVSVVPSSWTVNRVTTITTSEGQMTEATNSYATSVTEGQSSSVAETTSWNNWEEVSKAREAPEEQSDTQSKGSQVPSFVIPAVLIAGVGIAAGVAAVASAAADIKQAFFTPDYGPDVIQNLENIGKYTSDLSNGISNNNERLQTINSTLGSGFQGVQGSLDSVQRAINNQGQLISWGLHDISYQLSRPRVTETKTSGESWGGAQTTTHEQYEEHTITEGQAFTSGQNWSTAWAVDSSHAADLTFNYTIENTGTEYAREITGLIFNIYLGDDTEPIISYPAWEQFPNGMLQNVFPGNLVTFASNPVALTLEQMMRIDLGEPLTVVLADFSYGADELFYQDAVNGGITAFIEDGVEDGNELVDRYVIPTWGVETVQDVLTRYFPDSVDEDGNLNSLWTPEFNGINPPAWNEYFLSDIAWWNIYQTCDTQSPTDCANVGATPLHQQEARAGGAILFRFNRDSDRDGYKDSVELRYDTDKDDPASHPQPELLAGFTATRSGDEVTVLLKLENTGSFDAYGIDAVMYAPDATTTIGNNTVGGNGVVRPGAAVAVGSLILEPDLTNWNTNTADPYAGGNYTGSVDQTFTFSVGTPGVVGQGSATLNWAASGGGSGSLAVGSSYHSPLPIAVANGLEIGLTTGALLAGQSFTVQALTPRDTFTYTVSSQVYTPPVIVVSYSDPQGSHKFITPVQLNSLADDLTPYAGQMLPDAKLEIVSGAPFDPVGPNTTYFTLNSPDAQPIEDAHLYVNFVMSGTVVAELPYTLTLQPGPTVHPVTWSTSVFTQTFNPDAESLMIAFWTDAQGNIIDSAARPLPSLQTDPLPVTDIYPAAADFGNAAQGTLLQATFAVANTGFTPLRVYADYPDSDALTVRSYTLLPGDTRNITVRMDTSTLPVGAYAQNLLVRTNDPNQPLISIPITGNITPGVPDLPPGSNQRPLDWDAYIAGSHGQGEWVEFTHTLGPGPTNLHPVKVYSQDYATFWGVGKYATPFSEGTATGDMFGDGRDGVMPSSGNLDNNNGVGVGVVNSGNQGSFSITVTDAYAVGRINPGDVVLIHQTQGNNAGCWEINKAVSDFGGGTAVYQLAKPMQCTYTTSGNNHAQIQRIPQYTDCPITGTVTRLVSWYGSTGGIFAIMCSETANVSGMIANNGGNGSSGTEGNPAGGQGGGFQGGMADHVNNDCQGGGQTGEGNLGPLMWNHIPNGNGGASGDFNNCNGSTGGGGGNGSRGGNGTRGNLHFGEGGYTAGNPELSSMVFGGGGGGSAHERGHSGGGGGSGGGIIIVIAKSLGISGNIIVNGGNGAGSDVGGGGGGGGSILLRGRFVDLGSNRVIAVGGAAGSGAGGGSVGRIRIEYCDTLTGTTNPPASTQKLSCYIAEQVETSPYDHARLNLPESFSDGRHYAVQYGRRLVYTGAGEQVTTLRMPVPLLTTAILDVLLSDVPAGSVTMRLDIGNDAAWDWEWTGNVTGATTLNSPDLAAAFNAYWSSHGAPGTGTLDVPVRLYLSKAGQALVTNVQAATSGSALRFLRLPAQTYNQADLTFMLGDSGSGNVTVAVDVGDDASIEWSWAGAATFPINLTTGDLANAINAYLTGQSGQVDVPIRFYASPTTALRFTRLDTSAAAQPDITLMSGDIAFSNPQPTEGNQVTTTATLHNPAAASSGSLTALFMATFNGGPEMYIGSALVPDVPAGGSAPASIQWDTTGFTGPTTVRVVADAYNRLSESNEANNEATASLTILTRPDLVVKSITPTRPARLGMPLDVTVKVMNTGQTNAGSQTISLYQGDPNNGGVLIGQETVVVNAGAAYTSTISWTPSILGDVTLYAVADRTGVIDESDESNNTGTFDTYVGWGTPVYIDAGGAGDVAYDPAVGYGYLTASSVINSCGGQPFQTYRQRNSGETLQYQFNHLLPGRFYHLDMTFFLCSGSRSLRVLVDGVEVLSGVTANTQGVAKSVLLDPTAYGDHQVVVTIEKTGGGLGGPVVSELKLSDIRYCYRDSGLSGEAVYTGAADGCGWLDGLPDSSWGNLPYQTVRYDDDGQVQYRFDGLEPAKSYQLRLTLYENDGTGRVESVLVDGVTALANVALNNTPQYLTVDVPAGVYADGSIVVTVQEAYQPVVSEIALEEKTELVIVLPTPTPTFTPTPTPTSTPTPTPTPSPVNDPSVVYVSSNTSGAAGGVSFADEDVLAYDPATGLWYLVFDGSDVGLGSGDVDAFSLQPDGSLLLSLDIPLVVGDLGTVDDSDIVRFVPASLGAATVGSFELFWDGSAYGLTDDGEDVDALAFAPDNRLLVSTIGKLTVAGVTAQDEDLSALNLATGSWSLYFDGSDVGLAEANSEDVYGAAVNGTTGDIYLTTLGLFDVPGVSGDGADIFMCAPASLGNTTSCAYSLVWDGSAHGFGGEVMDALELSWTATPMLWVSTQVQQVAGGLTFADEDIFAYNPALGVYAMVFDGSDVGITSDVDAFSRLNDGSLLLSLDMATDVPGLGLVDDSDIIRFVPASLGLATAGSLELYFDGSAYGLADDGEDIDALALAPDGRLLVSTVGNLAVNGLTAQDEDLSALDVTSGVWSLYFDGSDVALSQANSEDVNGVWVNGDASQVYLTTLGAFDVPGATGDGSDVLLCQVGSLGNTTSCTYSLYWDGSMHGVPAVLDGLELIMP